MHALKSLLKDRNDRLALDSPEWREAEGSLLANYHEHVPFFFTRTGSPLSIEGIHRGGHAFLVANGPSLSAMDLTPLKSRWCMTMNNGPRTFRGNANCVVDDPAQFSLSTWLDPSIIKFTPMAFFEKPLWDNRLLRQGSGWKQQWELSTIRAGDCPNVAGYRRNERFDAARWLWEDTINWGDDEKHGGGRSVMLAALRILFLLGFRQVYLLGVDFEMSENNKYHFPEHRPLTSIRNNISTYGKLQQRFAELQPHFLKAGFIVKNCNPNSRLTAFPFLPYEEALNASGALLGDFTAERTEGMYRTIEEKAAEPARSRATNSPGVNGSRKIQWVSPFQRRTMASVTSSKSARVQWLSPLQRRRVEYSNQNALPLKNAKGNGNIVSPQKAGSIVPMTPSRGEGMKPLVAAVVTCHNYGRFLRQCLDSLLAQTLKFDHIHVVNDSSEDDTAFICDEYETRGVSQQTGNWHNFTEARKAGVAFLPRTRYLVFVDADNWLSPDFLERLMKPMADPRLGVSYPMICYVDAKGSLTGVELAVPFKYHRLRIKNYVDACALVRTEAYIQAGGWTENDGLTDWLLWLKLTRCGWQMQLVNEAKLFYRKHGANMHAGRKRCGRDRDAEVDVFSKGLNISIVTLFSGREWMLQRYANSIRNLDWRKDSLRITAIDNSCREEFAQQLHTILRSTGIPFTIIKDHGSVNEERPDMFADNAKARVANTYRLSEHIARLYSLARESMPVGTDLVWSIEDDIETPPDALKHFCEAFVSNHDAGGLSACVQSRFRPGLLTWQGNWKDYEATDACHEMQAPPPLGEAWPLLGGGFMCSIFRRELWDMLCFRPSPMWDMRRPWYDWAVGRDTDRLGWKWLVLGSVHCGHWQKDGTCRTPGAPAQSSAGVINGSSSSVVSRTSNRNSDSSHKISSRR